MSNINKLRLRIVADVVVTKEVVLGQEMGQLVSVLLQWLLIEMVADSHSSIDDQVHLKHLFLFIIDDALVVLV